jgi:radical SAM superfamily enzyme YgiQ (UPF0313 family)
MRVVLINPCNTYELVGNDPVIIKEQQGILPPLGLLYIAAYLKQTGRYEVRMIDAQVEGLTHEQVGEEVEKFNPDAVGIMAMTFTLQDVKLVVEEVRKRTRVPLIIGGPHVVIYPNETIDPRGLGADYAVIGEGEVTMDELLQEIALHGSSPKKIWRQERFIEDLDALPFPARELTPYEKYYSVLSVDTPTTSSFSSRGCPFSCSFCDRPALGKGFRAMTATRVTDEIEWCVNHGIKEIFFYDDTFSVSKKRVHEICNEVKRRGISSQDPDGHWKHKLTWDVRTRVNVVDEALLQNMREAGCERIHFGIESAVPRVIKELAKGITTEQVEDAFALCKKHGIKTLAYLMMGNPTETHEDILTTLELCRRIEPDFMQMTILSPFPATAIYFRALKDGLIKTDVWKRYAIEMNDDFRPPLWLEKFTRNELESELRWFYSKFYLNPRFIKDRILEIKNVPQFKRYAKAGLSLLKMTLVPESKLKDSWGLRNRLKGQMSVASS